MAIEQPLDENCPRGMRFIVCSRFVTFPTELPRFGTDHLRFSVPFMDVAKSLGHEDLVVTLLNILYLCPDMRTLQANQRYVQLEVQLEVQLDGPTVQLEVQLGPRHEKSDPYQKIMKIGTPMNCPTGNPNLLLLTETSHGIMVKSHRVDACIGGSARRTSTHSLIAIIA